MRLLRFLLKTLFMAALSVGLSLLGWWLYRRFARPAA